MSESKPEPMDPFGLRTVAPKAYEDLAQPAAKELGQGLLTVAKTVRIALAPLEGMVWAYDQVRSWLLESLNKKLEAVAPEKIQPPPLNIAGPAIRNLPFVGEIPILRDMYSNLLATAMNKDTVATTHPAFVQIIEQLTPDEAKALSFVSKITNRAGTGTICNDVRHNSPFGENPVNSQWRQICMSANVDCLANSECYLDNLLRLRILGSSEEPKVSLMPYTSAIDDEREYSLNSSTAESLYLTDFGQAFLAACLE